MDRINGIIRNACYQECLQKNRAHEETRIFCRHDMAHFLDVARLAWIENLERGSGIDRELVYAAALCMTAGVTGSMRMPFPMNRPAGSWLREFWRPAALRRKKKKRS